MTSQKRKLLGDIGQWLAGTMGVAGIITELILGAHLGYILITGGAVIGFISTKIKHHLKK